MTSRRPLRRRLMGTYNIDLRAPAPARAVGSGSARVMLGFAAVLALGTLLLMLPVASSSGEWTRFPDALFTATSALCVTGLVVVETQDHWSFTGEAIILGLFFTGGLGYMLGASLMLWILGRRLGLRDTYMLRVYYGAPSMNEALQFAKRVALFAVGVQVLGAVVLYVVFLIDGVPADRSVWWSLFHAASAFNNAGFNVTGNDLVDFRNDTAVLLVVSALVVVGGIGAIPLFAVWERRSFARLPLDSKLILLTTATLLVIGTVFVLAWEWNNEATVGSATPAHRPVLAFFQSAVPRTAGFSAIDVQDLRDESKFFEMALMMIGGAAGSTAGGIKVGTFTLLLFAIVAAVRGRSEVSALGRLVPIEVVLRALAIVLLWIAAAFAVCLGLLALTDFRDIDVLFEALSAMGTVGLSTGVTRASGDAAHVLLILAMLVGRFGPLLLVLEMTRPRARSTYHQPQDSVRLG